MLGLEITRGRQVVNLGWLLLVPCLEAFSNKYGGWRLAEAVAVACLKEFRKL